MPDDNKDLENSSENNQNSDYLTNLKELQQSFVELSKNIAGFRRPGLTKYSYKKTHKKEESSNHPNECKDSDSDNGYTKSN